MEYSELLKSYAAPTKEQIAEIVTQSQEGCGANLCEEVFRCCLACVDLTTLRSCDSEQSVRAFAAKVARFYADYPEIDNVASIALYPNFVESAGLEIDATPMKITSVAGGFPASQTFLEVKALECAMAVESGADEVDIVMNVGEVLSSNFDQAASEVALLREEVGSDTTFKVIIESGELDSYELIHAATHLSIMAGADFVKSSTGKSAVSATPQGVAVMCRAIKQHFDTTGERVGIKVAGGVRTAEDAALYYTIVKQTLGEEWLTPSLFRIGASAAANNLLSAILGQEVSYFL